MLPASIIQRFFCSPLINRARGKSVRPTAVRKSVCRGGQPREDVKVQISDARLAGIYARACNTYPVWGHFWLHRTHAHIITISSTTTGTTIETTMTTVLVPPPLPSPSPVPAELKSCSAPPRPPLIPPNSFRPCGSTPSYTCQAEPASG